MNTRRITETDIMAIARYNMVESQIKPSGVTDDRLCRIMSQVAREAFVPSSLRDMAYADCAVNMAAGHASRLLPPPTAFARLCALANIQSSDIVLDIAGGTGYAAAIFAHLANMVIALEEDESFCVRAGEIWQDLKVDNAVAVTGELALGQAQHAPFDVIFINGLVQDVPQTLLDQLAINGRLICAIIDEKGAQKACAFTRHKDTISTYYAFDVNLPDVSAFNREATFQF